MGRDRASQSLIAALHMLKDEERVLEAKLATIRWKITVLESMMSGADKLPTTPSRTFSQTQMRHARVLSIRSGVK